MSDPRSTYGEPVEEPTPADDVVARAHDSLAHAEAVQQGAVDRPDDGADRSRSTTSDDGGFDRPGDATAAVPATARWDDRGDDTAADEQAAADRADAQRVDAERLEAERAEAERAEEARWESYRAAAEPEPDRADTQRYDAPADRADPVVATPAAAPVAAPTEPVAPQPIFVQAPEAPRPRGNRGAAGAIGLLAALAFAVLFLGVRLALGLIDGSVTGTNVGGAVVTALTSWAFWVPVVVFFLAFWLLGAVINRGRWASWVIFGLLVGLAAWAGHILGQLFQAPFWLLTASEGARLVEQQLLAPLAIAAFVIGRELTIWFGAWVAARGRRVTELNTEAQREYERTLEAGPQLARI